MPTMPTPGMGAGTGKGRFFFWVPKWDRQNHDISEEAWIAQEDLWIYRELFRLVKKANDYVANFVRSRTRPARMCPASSAILTG
jgi:hypothetical protein